MKIKIFLFIILSSYLFCYSQTTILKIRQDYLDKKNLNIEEIKNLNLDKNDEIIKNLTLFEIFIDQKNSTEAEKYINYLSTFYPIIQLLNYRLADYYLSIPNYQEAKKYLDICIKNDSRFHEARYLLANLYYETKDYKKAYRHYNVLSWFTKENKILNNLDNLSFILGFEKSTDIQKDINFYNVFNSSIEIIKNSPYIDVGISTKDNGNLIIIDTLNFFSNNDFEIYNDKDEIILSCNSDEKTEWTIKLIPKISKFKITNTKNNYFIKSKFIKLKHTNNNSIFYIKEYKNLNSSISIYKQYRGEIIIKNLKNKILVINRLNLDEYLYSVLAKEIGINSPKEALKSQAVISRTTALYRKKHKLHKNFDVCSGQHCQVYDGINSENINTINAVLETFGEVILYDNNLAHTFFHANCGGITSSGEKFFVNKNYLSKTYDIVDPNYEIKDFYYWYLTPPNLYCNDPSVVHLGTSRWLRIIKKEDLLKHINKRFKIGNKLNNIQITKREPNGYIKELKIEGNKKTVLVKKDTLIKNITPISLRSSSFIIEYNKNNDCYYFWGAGWGHAVGMCQNGSCVLAEKKGFNYLDIIKHYYKDVELKKIY